MVFNSFDFIVFFSFILLVYYLLPHRWRWVLLLLGSCFFYAAWNPLLLLLLFFSVGCNFGIAKTIDREKAAKRRRGWLVLSLVINFGILFLFKYLLFFTDSLAVLCSVLGLAYQPPAFSIILPMGISFYTFQAAGYTIDVYRKQIKPQQNLFKFTLFITFFPQLVAGPIERADHLMLRLFSKKKFKPELLIDGFKWMALGFFKKVVIADRVAVCVNTVYNAPGQFEGLAIVVATVLFAFQIYCDFSGYSDIAIGCARMLGIELMENFKQPYFSRNIKTFWRRWHISLSSWFKDYVYFPLGGNRVSQGKHMRNTLVTFLTSGLWHGANWTFVVWGALHGGYQIVESLLPKSKTKPVWPVRLVQTLVTFGLVCFAWIFFRANQVSDAFYMVGHLFTDVNMWTTPQYVLDVLNGLGVQLVEVLLIFACILFLMVSEALAGETNVHVMLMKTPGIVRFAYYLVICLLILSLGVFYDAGAFIYFQF